MIRVKQDSELHEPPLQVLRISELELVGDVADGRRRRPLRGPAAAVGEAAAVRAEPRRAARRDVHVTAARAASWHLITRRDREPERDCDPPP